MDAVNLRLTYDDRSHVHPLPSPWNQRIGCESGLGPSHKAHPHHTETEEKNPKGSWRLRLEGCWTGKKPQFCRTIIRAKIYLFIYIEHSCVLTPAKVHLMLTTATRSRLAPFYRYRNWGQEETEAWDFTASKWQSLRSAGSNGAQSLHKAQPWNLLCCVVATLHHARARLAGPTTELEVEALSKLGTQRKPPLW